MERSIKSALMASGKSAGKSRGAAMALQVCNVHVQVAIYCEAGHTAEALSAKAKQQFGISVTPRFAVVPLPHTHLLAPQRWPRLTIIMQALASAFVAWGGLAQLVPAVRFPPTSAWRQYPAC